LAADEGAAGALPLGRRRAGGPRAHPSFRRTARRRDHARRNRSIRSDHAAAAARARRCESSAAAPPRRAARLLDGHAAVGCSLGRRRALAARARRRRAAGRRHHPRAARRVRYQAARARRRARLRRRAQLQRGHPPLQHLSRQISGQPRRAERAPGGAAQSHPAAASEQNGDGDQAAAAVRVGAAAAAQAAVAMGAGQAVDPRALMHDQTRIRLEAIQHVRTLRERWPAVPAAELRGFDFDGQRILLRGQQGIFKPAALSDPLSITTTLSSHYTHDTIEGSCVLYDFVPPTREHENETLKRCAETVLPLIYFLQLKKRPSPEYAVFAPVYVVGWDGERRRFLVDLSEQRPGEVASP